MSLLNVGEMYARAHDILFNPSKTTCTYFSLKPNRLPGESLHFMNSKVVYVNKCTVLGISIEDNYVTDRIIQKCSQCLYSRANELFCDFNVLNRDMQYNLLSTYCLDACGSQLWPFYNEASDIYFCTWRKIIRKLWRLPYNTHCRFLHNINDSLPIGPIL